VKHVDLTWAHGIVVKETHRLSEIAFVGVSASNVKSDCGIVGTGLLVKTEFGKAFVHDAQCADDAGNEEEGCRCVDGPRNAIASHVDNELDRHEDVGIFTAAAEHVARHMALMRDNRHAQPQNAKSRPGVFRQIQSVRSMWCLGFHTTLCFTSRVKETRNNGNLAVNMAGLCGGCYTDENARQKRL